MSSTSFCSCITALQLAMRARQQPSRDIIVGHCGVHGFMVTEIIHRDQSRVFNLFYTHHTCSVN